MTDWIEHNGGPQPVGDDVWVEAYVTKPPFRGASVPDDGPASIIDWSEVVEYCIVNQHLIDAARLEGIRLGLEAAVSAVLINVDAASFPAGEVVDAIRALNPDTIAKEAQND